MDPARLFVVGTSHSVAPAALRERLHVQRDELHAALGRLGRRGRVLREAVPLATCARLELYAVSDDPRRAVATLGRIMARRSGLSPSELRTHSYVHVGADAVRHLLRVASGLDSVVHGEAQVLGQVRDAYEHPAAVETAGPVLHRLFQDALATGKRVRSQTDIGKGAASLATAALALLRREAGPLEERCALVLGAGDTGSLVAGLLRKAGVGRLIVANRTLARARRVAAEHAAEHRDLRDLPALLEESDIVVGAVEATGRMVELGAVASITSRLASSAPNGRGGAEGGGARPTERARYFMDLAHPRNFDPAIAELPGVRLFDLDLVFRRVTAARAARATEVPRAEAIVEEAATAFVAWQRSRDGVSVLRAVRGQVLELAQMEAERHGQGRTEAEREELRRFARSLARALLHPPTVALREADATSAEGRSLLESATRLFGVEAARDRPESA